MRVLVVEDDPQLREAVRAGLAREGMSLDVAGDGGAALALLEAHLYDVVVLDRDIPGPNGDQLSKWINNSGHPARVLMLTAAARIDQLESGFSAGADDYVTKPFSMRELVLRVRALARRNERDTPVVYEVGGLRLDTHRHEVLRDGQLIPLTRKQFAVLEVLMSEHGGVVSAESLLERAWDENADPFSNPVRFTISMLRKRLGEPWVIHTVPGVGYRIGAEGDPGHHGRPEPGTK